MKYYPHFLSLLLLGCIALHPQQLPARSASFTRASLATTTSGSPNDSIAVAFDNSKIQYEGRVAKKQGDATYLFWPGTTIRIHFKGTTVKVIMQDDSVNTDKYRNYFNVIVDGKLLKKIKIEKQKQTYTLVTGLPAGKHVLELFKRNSMHPGYPRGYAKLFAFELIGPKAKLLSPPKPKKRKIEFYGNSITCGYGDETPKGNSNLSINENNYLAYGAVTARHFDAQYYCIAKSGIGLTKSTTKINMPQMYDLVNPFDTTQKWDFSQCTPDIVVVNLLQNDASLNPDLSAQAYIAKYKTFLQTIRNKYHKAYIICLLGPMNAVSDSKFPEQKWRSIIQQAVQQFNDDRVFTHFFPYLGRSGHPNAEGQQKMADSLIDFIAHKKEIHW